MVPRPIALSIILVVLLGCRSNDGTQPTDDNSIESQISRLFQAGPAERDAALTIAANLRQQLAGGATAAAKSQAFSLIDLTITSLQADRLIGGKSAATGDSAARLIDAIYRLVGLTPPQLPAGALTNDGAARVVGPQGGQVATPSGVAGVEIPAGALQESVLLTVTRLATPAVAGTGPLPTTLRQYPPFYEFATYPGVVFSDSLRVGVCQVTDPSSPFYPPEPHDRLRLAHAVGASVEILDRVDVNDLIRCNGVSASTAVTSTGLLASIIWKTRNLIWPSDLYAAHGGLGGKTKKFSPFGAVDKGPLNLVTTRKVDSRATFLRSDVLDSLITAPQIIDLASLEILPGDRIRLERLGDIKFSISSPDNGTEMIALFSATSELLSRNVQNRVPGAISSGAPAYPSPVTSKQNDPTDIPQDFRVGNLIVIVPPGARFLFVGVSDIYYSDNSDPDDNFAIQITPLGVASRANASRQTSANQR